MAGRTEYLVAHPNGEDHERILKGGKRPVWAVMVLKGGEWVHWGWSYKEDKLAAAKSAKSGAQGWPFELTRVIPTR